MLTRRIFALSTLTTCGMGLAGCGSRTLVGIPEISAPRWRLETRTLATPDYGSIYADYPGERFPVQAIDYRRVDPQYLRQTVEFPRSEPPGSIVVDPAGYHLYFVESSRVATRYGVGVGREGFGWSGNARVNMKRDWADWVPPPEMVERDPDIRSQLEQTSRGLGVRGGPKSPLGARTMYLAADGRDIGYRIHGTLEPYTVGTNVSSGCIRMINQDIIHLYARVPHGAPVTVLPA